MLKLRLEIGEGALIVLIAVTATFVLHVVLCSLHHCRRHRDLTDEDAKAFSVFAEVYKCHKIEIPEDLFELKPLAITRRLWNFIKCVMFCLPKTPPRAKQPASAWASLGMEMGPASSYLSQLASKIDQALLVYQSQLAKSLVVYSWSGEWIEPKDELCTHFPSFIVAEEWRRWARTISHYSQEAQLDLLRELETRLEFLDEIETGLGHPRLSELQYSYGWDTNEELSLLKAFTTVVSPSIWKMKSHIHLSMLQKSHATLMKSAFYISKRLITQIIRFFECVLHQDDMRVKSFIQEQRQPRNIRWYFWAFLTWPQFAAADGKDLMKHLHVPDRDPEWRKLCHIDAVLLAWYSLIQHLLLDDSTPDDESTYDVITRLRRSEEGFFYGFNDLMAGFDYRTYKEMPQGHDAKNVEPIRVHHRDCFLKSYSANDFGLSEEKFRELVDIMSFFISRTLFATNQLATLLLLQASLPLIVGRLFTDELFGKQHLFSVLNFAKMVTDQLRYQTDEIKTILLDGWQSNRRHEKNSTWCNLGPLDNFRLAMQAKKDIDKLLYDIDFLVEQMREQVAKTQISRLAGIEEVWRLNIEMYASLWTSVSEWQNIEISQSSQDISSAPEWKQQWLQHNQKLSAPLRPTGLPPAEISV